jgi:hypothetical protein
MLARLSLTALVCGLVSTGAAAETRTPLYLPACLETPPGVAFVAALQVELAALDAGCCEVEPPPATPPTAGIVLALEPCDPTAATVGSAVTDPALPRTVQRAVALADVAADARPRALALAVAELVRTLRAPSEPPVPPSPPPASEPAPVHPSVDADVELRLYPQRDTTLWGGRLSGALARGRWWGAIGIFAAAGNESFPEGTVALRVVGGGIAAGPHVTLGRFGLALAATGELGWAWAEGRAPEPGVIPGSGSALVAALGGRAALTLPVEAHIGLRATFEAGGVVHGLRANVTDRTPAGLGGPYLIAGLGVAVDW